MTSVMRTTEMQRLFAPEVVAVAGVSRSGRGPGNRFINQLVDYGYKGQIFVIHPTNSEVAGLPAFPSLRLVPRYVDYAYVAIPAVDVPKLLAGAEGNVAFAQVMSSGYGETSHGVHLERELRDAASAGGVRIIGPNCLGTHSPAGHITFVDRADPRPGPVGVISQSGGLGVDIIRRGKNRGIRFSGLVTVGNAIDVSPDELLQFYLEDSATKVIGLYLEGSRNGRRLFELLSLANGVKPVVLLKGGLTAQGQRAAASHTGSLASDDRIWFALARQTGTVLVESLDEFLDALVGLQFWRTASRPTSRVALFGNGGGTSVLAADAFARRNLDIPKLSEAAIAGLLALSLPPGTSVLNPIDAPAGTLEAKEGRVAAEILDILVREESLDAVVMHINLPVILSATTGRSQVVRNLLKAAYEVPNSTTRPVHFALVLRSDGEPDIEDAKRRYTHEALERGIPVYDELADAASALRALSTFETAAWKRTAMAAPAH